MPTKKKSAVNLPFIISTDRRKADPETRKLIRSHVMRGKNRVKSQRKLSKVQRANKPVTEALSSDGVVLPPNVPRLLCSRFSAIRFADEIEPALIDEYLMFASGFSKAMFLLHDCMIPGRTGSAQGWFEPMLIDPAYLHIACFFIQSYFDATFGRSRGAEAQRKDQLYYAKGIRALQERLDLEDDSVRLSDSTIKTVLMLYGHAYATSDNETANTHMIGLLKLVRMRGVETFFENTTLSIEIIRCDLNMAIDKGSTPLLFAHANNTQWPLKLNHDSTDMPGQRKSPKQHQRKVKNIPKGLDPNLKAVWVILSEFCTRVNLAADAKGPKIEEKAYLRSMCAVIYPLLHQRFEIGTADEAFRLGLLAFSFPIFLQWNKDESPDGPFIAAYREAVSAFNPMEANIAPREYTWLLTVSILSMSHEPDSIAWLGPCLQIYMKLCDVLTWESLRDLMKSFLWIGMIFDKPCQAVFESVLSQEIDFDLSSM